MTCCCRSAGPETGAAEGSLGSPTAAISQFPECSTFRTDVSGDDFGASAAAAAPLTISDATPDGPLTTGAKARARAAWVVRRG